MYPSSLKEKEWELIRHYFEPRDRRGRKPLHGKKAIVDGILYVLKSDCQWRMPPGGFPPWQTVCDYFSRWNKRGVWEAALDAMNQRYRKQQKKPGPSYGIIDSPSVKTVYAREERGIDGGKQEVLAATAENMIRIAKLR